MVYGEEVIRILPEKIANETKKFISDGTIQEIRIKVGKPIILILSNEEKVLNYVTTNDEVKGILVKISNYSLYAYEEEIKQGYITIKGGHRVGIAGECVISNGEIKTIKNISSLNIRISKAVVGSAKKIMPIITGGDRIYNTLIVSPPKCGKTTILRDIAKNISNGVYSLGLKGKKVVIIDERSEVAACYNGVPQMDVGIRTDVLDNCLKKTGMIMAIRSLSPDVLICDEIGTLGEVEALNMAFNSGVNIVVTVHGFDIEDIYSRKVFKELIDESIIERVVILSSRKGAGTIERIYKIERGEIKCLEL
ncbi:stage III sporulation protein AA [Clostridium sp. NSJ-49]|uniref:Stage III sporulation protein AA n=1 Tax=Clostridium disporicum TaxID=84024 RepID=A0A174G9C4_9CLOT|nr:MULTISPECIES: stage III sporulation protein AA [Clostridium]MBC5625457.1 stage III sporulation protein AA [Clostridium sp. NSJ-49]MCD2500211.1 stage III sporulation protein AA [Clostridium sp. NSJ-145]CUO58217.1 stage III sporulation protein AA [Clostridium disporicum]